MQSTSEPSPMDNLTAELYLGVTDYMSAAELKMMRTLNKKWNEAAKTRLRARGFSNFTFDTVEKLSKFNETFSNDESLDDLSSAKFIFLLPVLASPEAMVHLDTFCQRFGHVVTRLTLDFSKAWTEDEWFSPDEKVTVRDHVTLLLSTVKGQLESLNFVQYSGLPASVTGGGPFPALSTIFVQVNPLNRSEAASAAEDEEAFILELSRNAPSIETFNFVMHNAAADRDRSFMPTVVRNLVQANAAVKINLGLFLNFAAVDGGILDELMTVPARFTELYLVLNSTDKPDELRKTLKWVGAQSPWLKKLVFVDLGEQSHAELEDRTGLVLPSLSELEELIYIQLSPISLIHYDSADYFPKLARIATSFTGNDFVAPLPSVTEVTIVRTPFTAIAARSQEEGDRLFCLAPFPNIQSLTCSEAFLTVACLYRLHTLTRLKIHPDLFDLSPSPNGFWDKVTRGTRKLTFAQILALPVPDESRNRDRTPTFKDLPNLKEFVLMMGKGQETVNSELDALLYISKMKKLQRLQKLVLELEGNSQDEIGSNYLEELQKYHNEVVVSRLE